MKKKKIKIFIILFTFAINTINNMILEVLKFVCLSLDELNIAYMLSGSIAMNTYTIPRMTRDIDIVVNLSNIDIDKFYIAFKERFYLDKQTIRDEVKRKGMFNIIDNQTGFKVDFIIRKDTDYRLEEFNRKRLVNDLGFKAWIVTIEDLIISKLFWIQDLKSDKQIEDINNLLENPNIDYSYLKFWCQKLNLKTYNINIDPPNS